MEWWLENRCIFLIIRRDPPFLDFTSFFTEKLAQIGPKLSKFPIFGWFGGIFCLFCGSLPVLGEIWVFRVGGWWLCIKYE